jgi:osmoprotectant transport system substrate-binding protein
MKRQLWGIAVIGVPLILAACGGGNNSSSGSSGGGSGSCPTATSSGSGNGATIKLGSKAFGEEYLLAYMTQDVLQAHGFTVNYTFNAADKAIGQALSSGTIDMYWQYTGTELGDYLNLSPGQYPSDPNAAFTAVQQKDAGNGLCWYAPTAFNDTNGIAISSANAATYGTTFSAFGAYLTAHPSTTVCIMSEFRTRQDGLEGLESKAGWPANGNYQDIQNTAEKPITQGQCAAGEVFTTDEDFASNGLTLLTDDKGIMPPDNAGLVIRQSVAQQYPFIGGLMAPIAAKLTTSVITQLDAVATDAASSQAAAHQWLVQNGFLSS